MRSIARILCAALCASGLFATDVRLPRFTRETLPNGVVVYLMPKPGVPLVNFRIVVRGGMESEPAGLAGISQVTAQLLRRGTTRRTADQFSNELDALGGTFVASATEQATLISSEFLKKDFDAGLDLTADALLHPAFPEAEAQKALARAVDAVRAQKDNPQAAIAQYFRAFFYGPAHPYGRPADEASLGRISRANLVDYAHRMYSGANMIVVVAGEFDEASARAALRKTFGDAPPGVKYEWAKNADPLPGGRLLLVDKSDATQTYFRIAQPGIARTDPDRTTVQLVNMLFGGRFTSMLNDALRVNSGLTYGAGSILDLHREPGALTISTYTRTETTDKAIDMALAVLKKLYESGITAEQLASVKAYMKGTYPRQSLETPDQLANALGDIELFGLNRGEVDDLFSRIDAVTLERANEIAKQHFRPDRLTFVVLGNASKIRDSVKKYAPSVKEVSIKDPGFGE
ncbi:MAG TPA: pitrilysin family protein [Bryobacteraceae bacterium]|nr:pitrilysin family protein [Bryobacteraceae bacterium]